MNFSSKYHFLIYSILQLIGYNLHSQSFPVIISSLEDEEATSLVTLDDKTYHTIIFNGDPTKNDSLTLFTMDSSGTGIVFTRFENTAYCDASFIHIKENLSQNSYIAIGTCYDVMNADNQISFLRLDENFNLITQDTVGDLTFNEHTWDVLEDTSGNIYFSGFDFDNPSDAFIYKYDKYLNMIQKNILDGSASAPEDPYVLGIISMFDGIFPSAIAGFFTLTNHATLINKETLELDTTIALNYNDKFISLRWAAYLQDAKKFIIPFQQKNVALNKTKINIVVTDTNFNLLSSNSFGSPDQDITISNTIDYIDSNTIWFALTTYETPGIFVEIPNYIDVVKMNSAGEIFGETHFGGDAYYAAHSLQATPDGGALIMCERYDWTIQDHERDIYIYKIDSNGNLVNTATDIEPVDEQKNFLVYPNPAQDVLHFQSAMYEQASVEIFDLNGKKIQERDKNSFETTLDISNLAPGMYLYKISAEHALIKTGKFVKE